MTTGGIKRVIVGFCIDSPECRGFVTHYFRNSAVPRCYLFIRRVGARLNFAQQIIVFTLKGLVVSCSTAKIKNKLCGSNDSHCSAKPPTLYINAVKRECISY